MTSKNKITETFFQKRLLATEMASFMVCLCFSQPAFASLSEPTMSDISMSNVGEGTSIMTLQVSAMSPQDGAVLANFPTSLEVKVTRGDFPVQGARIQFWLEGGAADAFMHNAGLTVTDSSGYAHLTLLNQYTLDSGQYIWYASAYEIGFKGGSSKVISFVVPLTSNNEISATSGGIVATNQKEYSVGPGNDNSVVIYGNINKYHLGQPIVLKITSPSGKIIQMIAYGTYLGAFQKVYELGQNSEIGIYTVTIYNNSAVPFASIFYVVK